MFLKSKLINNIRFVASNIIWILVACYFLYHTFSGARGALSWRLLSRELEKLESELTSLKRENSFLENKINMLHGNNIDLDLLEEQSRIVLGFAKKNDIIVLLPN